MLYSNPVKEKLKKGVPAFFAMLRFSNPMIAQIIAKSGVDSICIDNEHYPFTDEQIINIVRAVHDVGVECTIRPSLKNTNYIYRLLDMGVDGLLFPNVETAEEAKGIIAACKYPPLGNRGCCPITAGAEYGINVDVQEYYKKKNDAVSIGIMIESKAGIENIEDILKLDGIDYFAVGPSDMSGSFGRPGRAGDPDIKAEIDALHNTIIAAGIPVESLGYSTEQAVKDFNEGKKVFNIGSDLQMLTKRFKFHVESVRNAIAKYSNLNSQLTLKEKFEKKQPIINCFVRIPEPAIAEIAGLSGADMVTLDNEHFPYTDKDLYNSIIATHLAGKKAIVRIYDKSPAYIGRLLDMGADGILAPQVKSAEEVEQIIQSVKYAPRGMRGYCPISIAADYGIGHTVEGYSEEANNQTIIGVMIETKEAIEDLDRILALDGLDYISVGPSDLSASYGYPGLYDVKVVSDAVAYANKAAIESKVSVSAQCYNQESAENALSKGVNVINIGSDLQFLLWGFGEHISNLKKAFC